MAETSIEWTHRLRDDGSIMSGYTFNPWIGCAAVHEGCKNCYAEADFDKRRHVAEWGPHGTRKVTTDGYWKKPLRWNKAANKLGEKHLVFCASLADVFEDREELTAWRDGLFELIDQTPNLFWLLLTKRPENILRLWKQRYTGASAVGRDDIENYTSKRHNVWLGTSISTQKHADKQIPELLKCRSLSQVLFLSCEPLLGPINLGLMGTVSKELMGSRYRLFGEFINWVIVGGESGPNARPMHPRWALDLRDECETSDVPFFFKQWGEWCHEDDVTDDTGLVSVIVPTPNSGSHVRLVRAGKRYTGNTLDGCQHLAFPEVLT